MLFENCKIKARRICNPIVDWEDRDVYEYIEDCKIQLNPLYECGWNRVGCIGCPLASKSRYAEFAMFPAYKRNYILAFERMLEVRKEKGKIDRWRSGMDVFHWWMEDGVIAGQVCMEHYEDR